jgi:aspartyl/asparaginyl-tRNA synthetase
MQKKIFTERMAKVKSQKDDVKTMKYDDDTDILNMSREYGKRNVNHNYDLDFEEEDLSDLKDSAGVKVIRYEEDIKAVYTSRNTCDFGYLAVIGVTKLTIYLAYADEIVATYD